MPNVFDQFDAVGANPFDQFDEAPAQSNPFDQFDTPAKRNPTMQPAGDLSGLEVRPMGPDTAIEFGEVPTAPFAIDLQRQFEMEQEASRRRTPVRDVFRDIGGAVAEIPKGVARGVQQAEAAVGSGVEAVGDYLDAQGKMWKRLYYESPIGQKVLERRRQRYIAEYGSMPGDTLSASPETVGSMVSDAGQDIYDFWREAANTGWERRNPEIYGGTVLENPSLTRIVGGAAESAPTMVGALALSAAGAPGMGLTLLTASEALPTYTEAKRMGASEGDAFSYALLSGIGTAALERVGINSILGNNKAVNDLVKKMGDKWVAGAIVNFAVEGTQEAVQQMWQNAVAMGYDEDRNIFEGALEAGLSGGILGGGSSIGVAIMNDYMKRQANNAKGLSPEQIDAAVRENMRPENAQIQMERTGPLAEAPVVGGDVASPKGQVVQVDVSGQPPMDVALKNRALELADQEQPIDFPQMDEATAREEAQKAGVDFVGFQPYGDKQIAYFNDGDITFNQEPGETVSDALARKRKEFGIEERQAGKVGGISDPQAASAEVDSTPAPAPIPLAAESQQALVEMTPGQRAKSATASAAEGLGDLEREVPLGAARAPVINPGLMQIGEEEFDDAFDLAERDLVRIEKQMDAVWDSGRELTLEERRAVAAAQDRLSAFEMEKFRRQMEFFDAFDMAHELKMMNLDREEGRLKAAILVAAASRRGMGTEIKEQILQRIGSDADKNEVWSGIMEQVGEIVASYGRAPNAAASQAGSTPAPALPDVSEAIRSSLRGRIKYGRPGEFMPSELDEALSTASSKSDFGHAIAKHGSGLELPEIDAIRRVWEARKAGVEISWPWEGATAPVISVSQTAKNDPQTGLPLTGETQAAGERKPADASQDVAREAVDKKRGGSAQGNALRSGGGVSIDTFKPDAAVSSPKEIKLFDRSKQLIKKHGGNRKILEGRNPTGTLGVSYNHTGNIALAALNNIGVAAHETTHNVDRKIKFTDRITRTVGETSDGKPKYAPSTMAERKALTEVYTEFYPEGKKNHPLHKRVTEGFATFVQKYIEDPETMRKRFPELTQMIIDESGKYYSNEVSALIRDARQIVNEYHRLDPLQKIGSRISTGKSKDGKPFLNVKDRIETELVDRIWPVEKLASKAGVQLTSADPSLYVREYERINRIFAHNIKINAFGKESYITMRNGEYVELYDFNWGTVIKKLHELGMEDSFDQYLVARRKVSDFKRLDELQVAVEEAKLELKAAGEELKRQMAEMDADQVSDKGVAAARKKLQEARAAFNKHNALIKKDNISRELAEQAVALAAKTVPEISTVEKMFDQLVRADLDLLKESGIISGKDYTRYSAEDGYATFKRDMYDDLIDPKTGKIVNASNLTSKSVSSLKERKGSERAIISPIYASIANHNEIMRKSLRQVIWNKVADLADKVPDLMQREDLKRIYDPNTGKTTYPQDQDPNVVMARRDGKRIPYVINAEIKKYLDSALTPEAVTIAEHLVTGASRLFTKGTTSLYPGFAAMNIMVDQVTASAQTRTGYVPIVTQVRLLLKALSGDASKEGKFIREYMILAGATQTSTGWNELSPDEAKRMVARESTALGKVVDAYRAGEKIFGIPGQASEIFTRASEYANSRMQGDNQFVALEKAGRVSAPFHHRGNFGGSGFARAWVRGVPYFNAGMQVVKEYGKTLADQDRSKRALLVTSLVIGAKLAELIPFMLLANDDQKEKYKDIHADYLARYIFIPHPNGEDLLKFRVPEQMTGLAAPVNMALQNYLMDNDYNAREMKDAGLAWLPDQFDVTEPKRAFLSWIPQLGKPTLEALMNTKTWPDTMPVESQEVQYDLPKYRAYRTTSEMAKALGEKTGLSPIKIDHLLQGYFGRSIKLVTKTRNELKKTLNPFLHESYFSAGRSVQEFYDQADAITQMRAAIKDGKEVLSDKDAALLEQDYQKVLSVKRGLKEYRDMDDERTPEAEKLRAKIIDTMDSLGTGEQYKEYFPRKSDIKKPKRFSSGSEGYGSY